MKLIVKITVEILCFESHLIASLHASPEKLRKNANFGREAFLVFPMKMLSFIMEIFQTRYLLRIIQSVFIYIERFRNF